jgi:hypothetical protein
MQTSNVAESKGMLWAGRIMSGLVTLFMVFDAFGKFAKPAVVIEESAKVGITGNMLTILGATLLISSLLYAFKKTSVLGAILLTAYLGGAVAANVCFQKPMFNIIMAIGFGVLTWGGIYLRDQRIRDLMPVQK